MLNRHGQLNKVTRLKFLFVDDTSRSSHHLLKLTGIVSFKFEREPEILIGHDEQPLAVEDSRTR